VRLHPTRPQPARQPKAVPTSFEGQCNPRDLAPALTASSRQRCSRPKQPFCTRLQLLARLALNAGKHAGNQPTRLAHLHDGNDRAILVQATRDLLKSFGWGNQGTPSVGLQRRWCHFLAACPIPSLRWRKMDSNLGPRSRRGQAARNQIFRTTTAPKHTSGGIRPPIACEARNRTSHLGTFLLRHFCFDIGGRVGARDPVLMTFVSSVHNPKIMLGMLIKVLCSHSITTRRRLPSEGNVTFGRFDEGCLGF